MHEIGIAQAIVHSVEAEAKRHPGERIVTVGLRVGVLSGVEPEALRFCFEALVRNTDLEPLNLEIDFSPRRHRCPACGREFVVVDYDAACPSCGAGRTKFVSGDEIEIIYMEMEDT